MAWRVGRVGGVMVGRVGGLSVGAAGYRVFGCHPAPCMFRRRVTVGRRLLVLIQNVNIGTVLSHAASE